MELLKGTEVYNLLANRPYVRIAKRTFNVLLRGEVVVEGVAHPEQFPVCNTALQRLTAVHKFVWRENALLVAQGVFQPAYVSSVLSCFRSERRISPSNFRHSVQKTYKTTLWPI